MYTIISKRLYSSAFKLDNIFECPEFQRPCVHMGPILISSSDDHKKNVFFSRCKQGYGPRLNLLMSAKTP